MSLYRLLKMAEAVYDSGDETAIKQMEAQFNGYVKKYCVAHYRPHNDGRTPNPWRRNMDYAPWENSPYYGSIAEFLEKFPGGIADWRKWREKTKKERNQAWSEGPTKGEMGLKKASIQERMKRISEITGIEKVAKGDLREELADLEHEQWMKWAKDVLKSEDISEDRAKRWKKECFKPYNKLSEEMKDFDREWADKVLKIVEKHKGVEKKAHYVPVGPDDVKKLEKEPHLYSDEGLEKNKSVEEFREKTKSWRENSASDMAKDSVKEFIDYWKLLLKVPERRKKRRGRRKKAGLDIKENKAKVNELRKQIDDLKPLKDKDLEGLSAKDLQALKIALEGRIFELGKAKEDKGTRKGADEILKTNLECLEKCLEKVKEEMGE